MMSPENIYWLALQGIRSRDLTEEVNPEARERLVEWGYSELKKDTGQDFGLDSVKWRHWLDDNPDYWMIDQDRADIEMAVKRDLELIWDRETNVEKGFVRKIWSWFVNR